MAGNWAKKIMNWIKLSYFVWSGNANKDEKFKTKIMIYSKNEWEIEATVGIWGLRRHYTEENKLIF